MRDKLMELMGLCYDVANRTEYKASMRYSGVVYDDIGVAYFNKGKTKYVLPHGKLTEEKLDYQVCRKTPCFSCGDIRHVKLHRRAYGNSII